MSAETSSVTAALIHHFVVDIKEVNLEHGTSDLESSAAA